MTKRKGIVGAVIAGIFAIIPEVSNEFQSKIKSLKINGYFFYFYQVEI